VHHSFLDRFSNLQSPIHSVDPRLKVLLCLSLTACTVSSDLDEYPQLVIYAIFVAIIWILSRIPVTYLMKRLALLIPFVLLISLPLILRNGHEAHNAFLRMLFIISRATVALAALTLLTSTTPFHHLLAALRRLGLPSIFACLASFLYSFIYVLIDEVEKLNIGRKSREFSHNRKLAWRGRTWLLGSFLIRSIERSERVYNAMSARGYNGETISAVPLKKIRLSNLTITIIMISAIIAIRFWGLI